ncbi:MAG: UDP-N-acetylglucosamine 1-carboxyvinyltransferase [Clostridia bacterium]|nr:UDP-N-acetylglucosamine 1-carboxyvinyltransferase [Clostridia bacterium]
MLKITGGNKLYGDVDIPGAKNSVLPIMSACLMNDAEVLLRGVPHISDCDAMSKILGIMGCRVVHSGGDMLISTRNATLSSISPLLAGEMRSSVFMLGPMLMRFKQAKLARPGGCDIGRRPIDIHLAGLRDMNVVVREDEEYVYCDASNIKPAEIYLQFPSVGATENLMMVACSAVGRSVIRNCAKEPEIVDLAKFLNSLGASIKGAGGHTIVVEGKGKTFNRSIIYTPIADRIVAGTYALACAMTGGELNVKGVKSEFFSSVLSKISKNSCYIKYYNDRINIISHARPHALDYVVTAPYPGFPTDMQSQMIAYLAIADGDSIMVENMFETRYRQVPQLVLMGADIKVDGARAYVRGVDKLHGAKVVATDLRGGASLVLAGLVAEGDTYLDGTHFLDRGYDRIDQVLSSLGAQIFRL